MSNNFSDVPPCIDLEDREIFALVFLFNILESLPFELDACAPFSPRDIRDAIAAKQLSHKALLSAAYLGFTPIWTSYRQFRASVKRLNQIEPHGHAEKFHRDEASRENGAASEYGLARKQLERFYREVDDLARSRGYRSFEDVFVANDDVLSDQDAHSPHDRKTYAPGPRYLWDLAKAANAAKLASLVIATFSSWVLILHLEDGVVQGYALPPAALRFGGFQENEYLSNELFRAFFTEDVPLITVPPEISCELRKLAETHFPGRDLQEVDAPSAPDVWARMMMISSLAAQGN